MTKWVGNSFYWISASTIKIASNSIIEVSKVTTWSSIGIATASRIEGIEQTETFRSSFKSIRASELFITASQIIRIILAITDFVTGDIIGSKGRITTLIGDIR
jgi:hypothetical protein